MNQKNIYFTIYGHDEGLLVQAVQTVDNIEEAKQMAMMLWKIWGISSLISVGESHEDSGAVFYTGEENGY